MTDNSLLPHVMTVTDEAKLKDYLAWVLAPDFDSTQAGRDGARFLSAVISISFDLRDYDYLDLERFDSEAVADAHVKLRQSLESVQPAEASVIAVWAWTPRWD